MSDVTLPAIQDAIKAFRLAVDESKAVAPAPEPAPEPVAEETPADEPVEKVSDDLLEALLADQPKEKTIDDEWEDVAATLKADKAAVQKEAIAALKKLATPDVEARKAALADLAKTVGVDLSGDNLPRSDADKAQIAALRDEIAQLKGQQVAAAKAKAEAEVKAFAAKHDDLDKFRPEMAKLLKAGIATDVKDAYKKAKALAGEVTPNIKTVKPSAGAAPAASKPKVPLTPEAQAAADFREQMLKAFRSK